MELAEDTHPNSNSVFQVGLNAFLVYPVFFEVLSTVSVATASGSERESAQPVQERKCNK